MLKAVHKVSSGPHPNECPGVLRNSAKLQVSEQRALVAAVMSNMCWEFGGAYSRPAG
jgi:hypothetical protein